MFNLPNSIEHYLSVLSKLYAQDGKRQFQEIIVNAQIRVHEEWSSDNWNGGTYGHALFLILPESIFLSTVNDKDNIRNQIREDLNKLQNEPNEFIAEVFFEMVETDHE